MNQQNQDIIFNAYQAFNTRNIDSVLLLMHPQVLWPNGWEGGYVTGHSEVRNYWTRQWKEIDPYVKPVSLIEKEDGRIGVEVHQVVKDMHQKIIFEGMVNHIYTIENGLIKSMEIEKL